MNIEEKEAIRGELSALELECAIVDGINIYQRDVLTPRGVAVLPKDMDLDRLKYEVASQVAYRYLIPKVGKA